MSKNRWQKIYENRPMKCRKTTDKELKEMFSTKIEVVDNYPEDSVKFTKGELLSDDFPVYGDYIYMMDDKAIRSDVFGTVWDLKRDLQSQGKVFENIYTAIWNY
jgi:hypothetical protein